MDIKKLNKILEDLSLEDAYFEEDRLNDLMLFIQTTGELYDMYQNGTDVKEILLRALKLYNKEIGHLRLSPEEKQLVMKEIPLVW